MRYIITLLFFFVVVRGGRVTHTVRVFIWRPRPGRRTAPVMIPNAFRFLIEVLFYFVRRIPDYVSRIRLPLGRFLFRRVSLFVTRSILAISSTFNEDVGVLRFTELRFYTFKAADNVCLRYIRRYTHKWQAAIKRSD